MGSKEEFVKDADVTSAFADTCILIDYVLQRDNDSIEILELHSARIVISKSVKHEYGKVTDRLKIIVQQMKTYAQRGELGEYSLPDDRFTKNDKRFVADLRDKLEQTADDKIEAGRRLKELLRWLKAGQRDLFNETVGVIDEVWAGSRPAGLQGYLRGDVDNEADVRVLCDAVNWSIENPRGTGTVVTADWGDMLSNREEIALTTSGHDTNGKLIILSPQEFLQV